MAYNYGIVIIQTWLCRITGFARIAHPLEMHLLASKCNLLNAIIKGVRSIGLYRTHLYLIIISHRYENNIQILR